MKKHNFPRRIVSGMLSVLMCASLATTTAIPAFADDAANADVQPQGNMPIVESTPDSTADGFVLSNSTSDTIANEASNGETIIGQADSSKTDTSEIVLNDTHSDTAELGKQDAAISVEQPLTVISDDISVSLMTKDGKVISTTNPNVTVTSSEELDKDTGSYYVFLEVNNIKKDTLSADTIYTLNLPKELTFNTSDAVQANTMYQMTTIAGDIEAQCGIFTTKATEDSIASEQLQMQFTPSENFETGSATYQYSVRVGDAVDYGTSVSTVFDTIGSLTFKVKGRAQEETASWKLTSNCTALDNSFYTGKSENTLQRINNNENAVKYDDIWKTSLEDYKDKYSHFVDGGNVIIKDDDNSGFQLVVDNIAWTTSWDTSTTGYFISPDGNERAPFSCTQYNYKKEYNKDETIPFNDLFTSITIPFNSGECVMNDHSKMVLSFYYKNITGDISSSSKINSIYSTKEDGTQLASANTLIRKNDFKVGTDDFEIASAGHNWNYSPSSLNYSKSLTMQGYPKFLSLRTTLNNPVGENINHFCFGSTGYDMQYTFGNPIMMDGKTIRGLTVNEQPVTLETVYFDDILEEKDNDPFGTLQALYLYSKKNGYFYRSQSKDDSGKYIYCTEILNSNYGFSCSTEYQDENGYSYYNSYESNNYDIYTDFPRPIYNDNDAYQNYTNIGGRSSEYEVYLINTSNKKIEFYATASKGSEKGNQLIQHSEGQPQLRAYCNGCANEHSYNLIGSAYVYNSSSQKNGSFAYGTYIDDDHIKWNIRIYPDINADNEIDASSITAISDGGILLWTPGAKPVTDASEIQAEPEQLVNRNTKYSGFNVYTTESLNFSNIEKTVPLPLHRNVSYNDLNTDSGNSESLAFANLTSYDGWAVGINSESKLREDSNGNYYIECEYFTTAASSPKLVANFWIFGYTNKGAQTKFYYSNVEVSGKAEKPNNNSISRDIYDCGKVDGVRKLKIRDTISPRALDTITNNNSSKSSINKSSYSCYEQNLSIQLGNSKNGFTKINNIQPDYIKIDNINTTISFNDDISRPKTSSNLYKEADSEYYATSWSLGSPILNAGDNKRESPTALNVFVTPKNNLTRILVSEMKSVDYLYVEYYLHINEDMILNENSDTINSIENPEIKYTIANSSTKTDKAASESETFDAVQNAYLSIKKYESVKDGTKTTYYPTSKSRYSAANEKNKLSVSSYIEADLSSPKTISFSDKIANIYYVDEKGNHLDTISDQNTIVAYKAIAIISNLNISRCSNRHTGPSYTSYNIYRKNEEIPNGKLAVNNVSPIDTSTSYIVTGGTNSDNEILSFYLSPTANNNFSKNEYVEVSYDITFDLDKVITDVDGTEKAFRDSSYYNGDRFGVTITGTASIPNPIKDGEEISHLGTGRLENGNLICDANTSEVLFEDSKAYKWKQAETKRSNENYITEWSTGAYISYAGTGSTLDVPFIDNVQYTVMPSQTIIKENGPRKITLDNKTVTKIETLLKENTTYTDLHVYLGVASQKYNDWSQTPIYSGNGVIQNISDYDIGSNRKLTISTEGHSLTGKFKNFKHHEAIMMRYKTVLDYNAFIDAAKAAGILDDNGNYKIDGNSYPIALQFTTGNGISYNNIGNGEKVSATGSSITVSAAAIEKQYSNGTWTITANTGMTSSEIFRITDSFTELTSKPKTNDWDILPYASLFFNRTNMKVYVDDTLIFKKGQYMNGWDNSKLEITGYHASQYGEYSENDIAFAFKNHSVSSNQTIKIIYDTTPSYGDIHEYAGAARELTLANRASLASGMYSEASTSYDINDTFSVSKSATSHSGNTIDWTIKIKNNNNICGGRYTISDAFKNNKLTEYTKITRMQISNGSTVVYDSDAGVDKINIGANISKILNVPMPWNSYIGTYGFEFYLDCQPNNTITINYTTKIDEEAYYKQTNYTRNITERVSNTVTVSCADGERHEDSTSGTYTLYVPLQKGGSLSKKDSDGSDNIQWTVNINLAAKFKEEQIAKYTEYTITDDMNASLQYDTNSITIAKTNGTPLSGDQYKIESVGNKVVITVYNPTENGNVNVTFKTKVLASVTSMSNSVDVKLGTKKMNTTSPAINHLFSASQNGTVMAIPAPIFTPTAKKYLDGKPCNTEFDFDLKEVDENGKATGYTDHTVNITEGNHIGEINFKPIKYENPKDGDVHYYQIYETPVTGWKYDKTVFTVKVTIQKTWNAFLFKTEIVTPENSLFEIPEFYNNSPSTCSFKVTKSWDDNNNSRNVRPESIIVKLYRDGTPYNGLSATLSDGNNWTYTWKNLPYSGSYTVQENDVFGYTGVVGETKETSKAFYEATVTNTISVGSLKVAKDVQHSKNAIAELVHDIAAALGLTNDEVDAKAFHFTVTINNTNINGTYGNMTFTDGVAEFDLKDNETATAKYLPEGVAYTVEEDDYSADGYNASCENPTGTIVKDKTASVKFVNTKFYKDVTVTKTWDDDENRDGIRPNSVNVILTGSDGSIKTAEITAKNNWTYTFSDLPVISGGENVTYTISEAPVDGYVASIGQTSTGFAITNTHEPAKEIYHINKVWEDNNNQDGIRPEILRVDIMGSDGSAYTVMLAEQNNWEKDIELLTNSQGQLIAYTFVEVANGYDSTLAADGTNITFTNTHTPETVSVNVTKNWNDGENQDGVRPDSIDVILTGSDGNTYNATIGKTDNWTHTFTDMPKYFNNGTLVEYSLQEVETDGYTGTVDKGEDGYTFTVTNGHTPAVVDVPVTKVWEDEYNRDGLRSDSVHIILTGSDGKTYEKDLAQNTGYSGIFTGLPKYNNGELISYSLAEIPVEGYETAIAAAESGYGFTVTNTHEPSKKTIKIAKAWEDANNQDGLRPTEITVKLLGSDGSERIIKLNEKNNWTHTFENLYSNISGKAIEYKAVEEEVTGYTTTVKESEEGFTITNKHTPKTVNMPVTKLWNDAENQDGIRPDSVDVVLTGSDGNTYKAIIRESDNWTYMFKGLPKYYDNGTLVQYSLQESEPEGYTGIAAKKNNEFTLTNAHTPETVEIPVTKVWNDNNNQDGLRPDSVKVVLTGSDGSTYNASVSKANGWAYTFTDLPKYFNNGILVEYSLQETDVDGYIGTVAKDEDGYAFTVTNEHTPEVVNVSATKVWDDAENQDGVRPDSIDVILTGSDGNTYNATISEQDNWTYTFTNLPKYFNNGTLVEYSLQEVETDEYAGTVTKDKNGYTFTIKNDHIPAVVDVPVTKVWDDDEDRDGLRPSSIHVTLTGSDGSTYKKDLEKDSGYSTIFTSLPKYHDGELITYSLAETPVEGYETDTQAAESGYSFTITNTHEASKKAIKVSKVWDDAENQDGIRPDSVTVTLTGSDNSERTVKLSKENDWTYTFEDLFCNAEGTPIKYKVSEKDVAGYTSSIKEAENGFIITNTHKPETVTVNIIKSWNDSQNADNIRPDAISITLTGSDNSSRNVTLNEVGEFKATVENLPKFHEGKQIIYSVTEAPVSGYASSVQASADGYAFVVINTHTPEVHQEQNKTPATPKLEIKAEPTTTIIQTTNKPTGVSFFDSLLG